MSELFENLRQLGDQLEAEGYKTSAAIVTTTMEQMLTVKMAQYVGSQGYWIRNRRCWDNCYRQKRATTPESSAQKVWTECHQEYLKSINDDTSDWNKYAEDGNFVKTADTIAEDKRFAASVQKMVTEGANVPEAIYSILHEANSKHLDTVVDEANRLMQIAQNLEKAGKKEISQKVVEAVGDMITEAGFWDSVGKGIGGVANWWQNRQVKKKHEGVLASLNSILTNINMLFQSWRQRGQKRRDDLTEEEAARILSAPTAMSSPQGLSKVAQNLNDFLSFLRQEIAALSQEANLAQTEGRTQTAQLIQGAIQAINTYFQNNQSAQQSRDNQSIAQALRELSTNLTNSMAGLEQVAPAEEPVAEEPEAEAPAAEEPAETSMKDQTFNYLNGLVTRVEDPDDRAKIGQFLEDEYRNPNIDLNALTNEVRAMVAKANAAGIQRAQEAANAPPAGIQLSDVAQQLTSLLRQGLSPRARKQVGNMLAAIQGQIGGEEQAPTAA